MDENSEAVKRMPDYVKGSPINLRTAPCHKHPEALAAEPVDPNLGQTPAWKAEMMLRRVLWLRHGCTGHAIRAWMYCECCGIDFARMPVDRIYDHYAKATTSTLGHL